MDKRIILIVYFALLLQLVACSRNTSLPQDKMPDIGVSSDKLNADFLLSAPRGWNTYQIGDKVTLEIKMSSNNQIAFERDFGSRIYIYDDNQWVEIKNSASYDYLTPEVHIFAPNENNLLNSSAIIVVPKLQDTSKARTIRIFLIGYIYRDQQITNEKTASYVDVRLTPK